MIWSVRAFLGEISVIGMKTQLDSCLHLEWPCRAPKWA